MEHPETLRYTIRNCKNFLNRQSYQDAAVVFLISQVGNDPAATAFLKGLENDEEVGDMVFCSTENLAAKLAQFQDVEQDQKYTAWVSQPLLNENIRSIGGTGNVLTRDEILLGADRLQLIELFLAALDKQTKHS